MPAHDLIIDKIERVNLNKDYKDQAFMTWYRAGQIGALRLFSILPLDNNGRKPTKDALQIWIREFQDRAKDLDEAVKSELNDRMIQEKVEMLNRHSEIAVELQDRALNYLRTVNDDDLGSSAAVRMLVEAIRIERISRGVPQVLEKMANMSDDDLLREAEKLLTRSPITEIEPLDKTNYEQEENGLPDLQ